VAVIVAVIAPVMVSHHITATTTATGNTARRAVLTRSTQQIRATLEQVRDSGPS
jgi:hypothetical protein